MFLPTLVFEAAYNLDFDHLRENVRTITVLAIPGVLLTASVVAASMHYVGGLDWLAGPAVRRHRRGHRPGLGGRDI